MRVPAVLMRGGTSRGLFFHERDLPEDHALREAFILAAYGSPDAARRQVDGVGGATSSTSKVAVISDGREQGVDVLYEFGQVAIDRSLIDRRGNCGNLSSGVGPFAVDEGLVVPTDPVTVVRLLNVNTGKLIVAHVPTRDGRFDPVGDFSLPGVPGTGSRIRLDYVDPGGAVTGAVLPTGNPVDDLTVPGVGTVPVSLVDAANPLLFVHWDAFGLNGTEGPDEIDSDPDLLRRLEAVRAHGAVLAGIADTPEQATEEAPSVPKLTLVGKPRDYLTTAGTVQKGSETTVRASMMSMGKVHRAYALTGGICTAVAAAVPGTLVADATADDDGECRIGHPAGVLPLRADVRREGDTWQAAAVTAYRSARRLMEGRVLVPGPWLKNRSTMIAG
ncbi:PrpF domain-containing protein [Streptomyces sp. DSM 42041]|uniref:PrpF domain-containing protein n=1 Tax=Streptomyces hazeniae TaxID=3075538 RepID=A0ABU2NPM6_9ACTN|nr:PrpF domain-containing protein [Streptomyces sp. DSM 42041]MDT0378173.1 PrpF domain-containing protein [Streptomyces sp. DSM 42041]